MHWKRCLVRVTGCFLLLGLLLFIAGDLAAVPAKKVIAKHSLTMQAWDEPDSLYGGWTDPEEVDGLVDPDDVDMTVPLTYWYVNWLIKNYF